MRVFAATLAGLLSSNATASSIIGEQKFNDWTWYVVTPHTDGDVAAVSNLAGVNGDKGTYSQVVVWDEHCPVERPCGVLVAPEYNKQFLSLNLDVEIKTEDVQGYVDGMLVQKGATQASCVTEPDDWNLNFQNLDAIMNCMSELEATYSGLMTLENIGTSVEGRPLQMVVVNAGDTAKPMIVFDGGCHAREWITPAVSTFFLSRIGAAYNNPSHVFYEETMTMLNQTNFAANPMYNPDGYEFSRVSNASWRKNRSNNQGSSAMGVDLIRNGASGFGGIGSSSSPSSDTYHGPFAWSEPEGVAIRDFIEKNGDDVRYYANIHTTAQQFLLPYGYTRDLPADYDDLMTFHNAVNDAMDYNYAVGPVYTTIYPASGIPSDAYYDGNGITRPVKYSTAWEWRGGGFQPNPTDPVFGINIQGEEMWKAMVKVSELIAAEFGSDPEFNF